MHLEQLAQDEERVRLLGEDLPIDPVEPIEIALGGEADQTGVALPQRWVHSRALSSAYLPTDLLVQYDDTPSGARVVRASPGTAVTHVV